MIYLYIMSFCLTRNLLCAEAKDEASSGLAPPQVVFNDVHIQTPLITRRSYDMINMKSSMSLKNRKRQAIKEYAKSLLNQIVFDDKGNIIPGQRVCLPFQNKKSQGSTKSYLKSAYKMSGFLPKSPQPNIYIVRAMRQIIRGDFMKKMGKFSSQPRMIQPDKHWRVNYSHENNSSIDLGTEFDLDNKSFTIVALIRLRPNQSNKDKNRGARILSKRDKENRGWEFVFPSYYTQTISFYSNTQPGHIDYGKSSIPQHQWTLVGIVFDRDSYDYDVAHITPYIDGLPDGRGTFMQVLGNLSSDAHLTVGHARDEKGLLRDGRRDFRLPGNPRYDPHFHGDIRDVFVWKRALEKQQLRRHAAEILRSIGRKPNPCPLGYEELDCKCYQVFDDLRTFAMAESTCHHEGGMLAMPKTERIQDFMEILMQQSSMWSFWIGLDDRLQENVKIWGDGKELRYNQRKSQFNKFPRGSPDKQYHTEDCVEELKTRAEFLWNDENCRKLNAYICEVPNGRPLCDAERVGTA